jgi:hypothetical protein
VPQVVPAAAFVWFMQTGVPVEQLKVPGLQAEPQAAPVTQAVQVPLPSQTWLPPHDTPGAAFF